ncbi:MAG: rane-bound O-acyltransferase family protein [Firmicutes bacterium]|nr:rane-bound O-acyltransferase family protein [Bacillota bacterium]
MLLGGLWHGAGWTFVIWGGLHGIYLAINHLWRWAGFTLPKVVAWLLTITSVVFAWVVFRANSVTDAYSIWEAMLGLKGILLPVEWSHYIHMTPGQFVELQYLSGGGGLKEIYIILLFMLLALCENQFQKRKFEPSIRWFCFVIVILSWSIFSLGKVSEFLYFQF